MRIKILYATGAAVPGSWGLLPDTLVNFKSLPAKESDMNKQTPPGTSSSDQNFWFVILTAAILVLAFIVAVGSLALMRMNQEAQLQLPGATQPTPAKK
jgi:hypothetical protein